MKRPPSKNSASTSAIDDAMIRVGFPSRTPVMTPYSARALTVRRVSAIGNPDNPLL